jgi:3-oxoacyl-[acyl-carrier protein] reductase
MKSGLKNKVVLLTGASKGMARVAALHFAEEGCKVAICARDEKALNDTANQMRKQSGVDVLAKVADVTKPAEVQEFVATAVKKFGRVDICVANAGGPPAKTFSQTEIKDWEAAIQLSFMSVIHLAKEVLPLMQKSKWGRFITITSTSVRQPIPDIVLSSAIRPAVVGLVKSLAIEYGKYGITVNNVAPGYTATERLIELSASRAKEAGVSEKEIHDQWAKAIPMGRIAEPADIADTIVWLASDRASYITGQTIMVDGGNYKGM